MVLSVDEKAVQMAEELAALKGQSVSEAVETALRESLEIEKRKGATERLMAIAQRAAPLWSEEEKTVDHGSLLYGDGGMPK